jgi:hypothetical protein
MPTSIDGNLLFPIGEALDRAGVSRATYFRWVREGRIPDARFRDRNGRRVLTTEELSLLERRANRLVETLPPDQLTLPVGAVDRDD